MLISADFPRNSCSRTRPRPHGVLTHCPAGEIAMKTKVATTLIPFTCLLLAGSFLGALPASAAPLSDELVVPAFAVDTVIAENGLPEPGAIVNPNAFINAGTVSLAA